MDEFVFGLPDFEQARHFYASFGLGKTWPSADHPGEDSLNVWGSAVPEDFVLNHEI